MKLLFWAAIRNSRHILLALLTLITLFFLSIADKLEVLSLGVIINNGADFFSLFSDKNQKEPTDAISLQQVVDKWEKIDVQKKGEITKTDTAKYLASQKKGNLFNRYFYLISAKLDFQNHLKRLIWALIYVAIFKAIFLFVSRYATQMLSIRISRDLRQQYFEHIQLLPMSFYQEYNLGSLTARAVGDASQVASSLNSCLTNYLQSPFTILTSLGACFLISWQLSLIIFVGLPLIVFPVIFLTKRIRRVSRQMLKNQETFTSLLIDFLSGIQTIKIFAMEGFSLKKFRQQNQRMAQLEGKSAKYSLLTRPVLHMITTACLVAIILMGLNMLHMHIAQLLMFAAMLHQFYEPVKKFSEENANVQKGIIAAERMFEVLRIKPPDHNQKERIVLKHFRKGIEFKNVGFKYKDQWVLRNLSFTLEKGQTLALVGPTGAGKSTIVQLLPRLYEIQEGDILIDGRSIQDYTKKSLRELISFVPQKPFLFYDTVAENIAFGRNFSRKEIESAAKKAHAHEFIIQLEKNYDSMLAETGKNLSGGQQQRLAIARALIKSSPILILDEATSALDAISEQHIKQALQELAKSMTQILIAHRLSTIDHADKIIYIDRGTKVAEGTKEELLKNSLEFQKMWASFHQMSKAKENA